MAVNIFEGKLLYFFKSPDPHILYHAVCDMVINYIHKPLGKSGQQDGDNHMFEDHSQPREVNQSLCKHQIHRFTDQNRDIERQSHRYSGQKQRQENHPSVMSDILKHPLHRMLLLLCLLFVFFL